MLYLIISSSEEQLRRQHYNQLLDTYYQILQGILLEAKIPKDIYSREMFNGDLHTVAPACLIVANTAIWLSSGLQQEGHVKSKIILKTEEDRQKAINLYKSRISSIFDNLKSFGYLENIL